MIDMDEKIDKVVDKTKNSVDKTKDTISSSPSSSFSNSQEKNYRESGHGVETNRTKFSSSEQKKEPFANEDIKKQELATSAAENTNPVDRKNNYRENNELINPFVMGIELWQNYSVFWLEYYKEMINHTARMTRDFGNTNEQSWKNSTKPKDFKVKVE